MTAELLPALWLCGTSGVGKSSVGWEIHRQLGGEGVTSAYVDLDQIRFLRPAPRDDDANHRIKAGNLGALWPRFRTAGARCLIVTGIAESRAVARTYVDALPDVRPTVCVLHATPVVLRERILDRGRGAGPPIPGDERRGEQYERLLRVADEAARVQHEMHRDGLGDVWVDTEGQSIEKVAYRARAQAGGWPNVTQRLPRLDSNR